ncbi:MAG: FAD-binding domain-containing protein [Armatimonadaceae bacterium]
MELKQITESREAAAAYLGEALAGLYAGQPEPAPFPGGRSHGLKRLRMFNAAAYAEKRNDVGADAGASQMSPYIRHGCVSLREAKQDAIAKIGAGRATKWIQELAWRQFWQLQYARYGSAIFREREEPQVRLGQDSVVPDDVLNADTGLNCMDTSLRMLYDTGYMFNHARMWFAAYLVHHRKVRWQSGAELFYRYLLDGDPASNTLSWQWVASTFSHKPYFFNRSNVEKYSRDPDSGETYCTSCPAAANRSCPFDASYEVLGRRLFGADYDHEDRGGRGGKSFHRRDGGRSGERGRP